MSIVDSYRPIRQENQNTMFRQFHIGKLFLLITLVIGSTPARAQHKITFPSKDGLPVTADLYHVNDSLPVILLCHQARFSRGEYREAAVKLNKFGFNCLAIDQRSGQEVN